MSTSCQRDDVDKLNAHNLPMGGIDSWGCPGCVNGAGVLCIHVYGGYVYWVTLTVKIINFAHRNANRMWSRVYMDEVASLQHFDFHSFVWSNRSTPPPPPAPPPTPSQD